MRRVEGWGVGWGRAIVRAMGRDRTQDGDQEALVALVRVSRRGSVPALWAAGLDRVWGRVEVRGRCSADGEWAVRGWVDRRWVRRGIGSN